MPQKAALCYIYREKSGLEVHWNRLVVEIPDRASLHSFEFDSAYFRHLSLSGERFICFALTDGERIRAICPFEEKVGTVLGRKVRIWGPTWEHEFFRDVICPTEDAERVLLPCLVRHLRRMPGPPTWFVFDRVLEGSTIWRCLLGMKSRGYCSVVVGKCDVFNCEKPFLELASRLSKNFRGNLRKARNKLADLADVHFVNATDPMCLEREFPIFLKVEGSGWKGVAGMEFGALRQREKLMGFYRDLVTTLRNSVRCEINTLYAEGRCIASQLCVRGGTEYAIFKIGYDEEYARAAPGQLLLERTLERCCQDPEIKRVNLVSGATWHRDWRTDVVPVHSVYIGLGRWSGPLLVRILSARFEYGPRIERWLVGGRRIMRWLRGVSMEAGTDKAP